MTSMDQGDSYEDCFAYGPFYFKELLTFIVQVFSGMEQYRPLYQL